MAKKYLSNETQTKHTYDFYKERRNDPYWENDYLRIKAIRQRNMILASLLVLVIAASFLFYSIYNNDKSVERNTTIAMKKVKTNKKKVTKENINNHLKKQTTKSAVVNESSQENVSNVNDDNTSQDKYNEIHNSREYGIYPTNYLEVVPPNADHNDLLAATINGMKWLTKKGYVPNSDVDSELIPDSDPVNMTYSSLPEVRDAYGHLYSYLWVTRKQKDMLLKAYEPQAVLFIEATNDFFEQPAQ